MSNQEKPMNPDDPEYDAEYEEDLEYEFSGQEDNSDGGEEEDGDEQDTSSAAGFMAAKRGGGGGRGRGIRNLPKGRVKRKRKPTEEGKGVSAQKLPKHQESQEKKEEVDDLWASLQAEAGGGQKEKKKKKKEATATGDAKKKPGKPSFAMWGMGSGKRETKGLDAAAIAALKKKTAGQDPESQAQKKKSYAGPDKVLVEEDQDYVGENIKVKKELVVGSKEHAEWLKRQQKTGLDAVLAAIGPKKQITTLNKSDIDWQQFKAEAKITDELEQHKRNGGYLEKQEFISRTEERWLQQDQAENRKRLGVTDDD